jgi:hypothetical protein
LCPGSERKSGQRHRGTLTAEWSFSPAGKSSG